MNLLDEVELKELIVDVMTHILGWRYVLIPPNPYSHERSSRWGWMCKDNIPRDPLNITTRSAFYVIDLLHKEYSLGINILRSTSMTEWDVQFSYNAKNFSSHVAPSLAIATYQAAMSCLDHIKSYDKGESNGQKEPSASSEAKEEAS